jgi:hypothetical protein
MMPKSLGFSIIGSFIHNISPKKSLGCPTKSRLCTDATAANAMVNYLYG